MPSNNKQRQAKADLSRLIKELKKADIEFILVGGVAAVAQGAPVTTFDLDVVHERTPENIKKIKNLLKTIGAYQRRPDNKILEPDLKALKKGGHMLLSTCFGPFDILGVIEKGFGYDELLPNTIEIDFQGYKIRVLNIETLVELKRESKRPEDRLRLAVLEKVLHQTNVDDITR